MPGTGAMRRQGSCAAPHQVRTGTRGGEARRGREGERGEARAGKRGRVAPAERRELQRLVEHGHEGGGRARVWPTERTGATLEPAMRVVVLGLCSTAEPERQLQLTAESGRQPLSEACEGRLEALDGRGSGT